jgi:hypothetical protein
MADAGHGGQEELVTWDPKRLWQVRPEGLHRRYSRAIAGAQPSKNRT